MINCDKRQKEIKKARDGSETEQHRCMEKRVPETYLKIVDVPTCEGCPILALKTKGCGGVAQPEPAWMQDLVEIRSVSRDVMMDPAGYEKELGYTQSCPYRHHTPDRALCRIGNMEINPEICGKCDQDTAEVMATVPKKMANYANAIRRWIREGRPVRSDEEVAVILEICKKCDLYDEENHACKKCGCKVSTDRAPLKNKLKMKSEVCPMGYWK